jgi:hypothetical protein
VAGVVNGFLFPQVRLGIIFQAMDVTEAFSLNKTIIIPLQMKGLCAFCVVQFFK